MTELTIRKLKKKDRKRGLVAISDETVDEANLSDGDFVSVRGNEGTTVARVWTGYRDGKDGAIHVDEQMAEQLGVDVGTSVSVTQTDILPADRVVVEVTDSDVNRSIDELVQEKLRKWAVESEQDVSLSIGNTPHRYASGRTLSVRVTETVPDETVIVTSETEIAVEGNVRTEVERPRTESPSVSYDSEISPRAERSPPDSTTDENQDGETDVSDVTYDDIGGLDDELERFRELIEVPLQYPELVGELGIELPQGVLLHGPPGTGKTLLAKAVANEIDAYFTSVSAPEIMSEYYGQSEEQLREIFEDAAENAPAIVFIDEIDAIAQSRTENSGDVEHRVVTQLLSLMDGIDDTEQLAVVATTNLIDDLDSALRRGGRFDHELEIGVPSKEDRHEILRIHTDGMPLSDDIDLADVAERTHGFVGADLELLAREAGMNAIRRLRSEYDLDLSGDEFDFSLCDDVTVESEDLQASLEDVEPSGMREAAIEVPDTSWEQVGGLDDAKQTLQEAVLWPQQYREAFEDMGLETTSGILMYGPPGTGKTLLARALANEADYNFISVSGPELFNKFVGESERTVRKVFERAKRNSPTIVYFDEIDALAAQRGQESTDSGVTDRVVSQLLTELGGLESADGVVALAATNRPDIIDHALLRPGRFEQHVHVPLPNLTARRDILSVHTEPQRCSDSVDFQTLAERTERYTGADLEAVCREAALESVRDAFGEGSSPRTDGVEPVIEPVHFDRVLEEVTPSVTEEQESWYVDIASHFDETVEEQSQSARIGFH